MAQPPRIGDHTKFKDAFGGALVIKQRYGHVAYHDGIVRSMYGTLRHVTPAGAAIIDVEQRHTAHGKNTVEKCDGRIVSYVTTNRLIPYPNE